MKVDLSKYSGMKICVALSGGRDSMALLEYLRLNCGKYAIAISALNCDHGIRGEESARDSAFVKDWCKTHNIPLLFFKGEGLKSEADARNWRISCYKKATISHVTKEGQEWQGVDAVATAHHLNDNAETLLFNLARGSSLSGATGIKDYEMPISDGNILNVIHPLITCSRADIDNFIEQNCIPYVTDSTNLTDDYTRNYIRHNVLPELEKAVPQAAEGLLRFSRLAADDEEYLLRQAQRLITSRMPYGYQIAKCEERVLFKRAAIYIVAHFFHRKDYTSEQAQKLYELQNLSSGKKYEFLGLVAFNEGGNVVIADGKYINPTEEIDFEEVARHKVTGLCGQYLWLTKDEYLNEDLDELEDSQSHPYLIESGAVPAKVKVLQLDEDMIPKDAKVRFKRAGDKFTKYGGGTKSLGDYFTDKKIPPRLRGVIPVIVGGQSNILAVCGVEICDAIKVTEKTKNVGYLICADYINL